MNLLRKKSLESVREALKNDKLEKTLGAFDLLIFGIAAIIGTGIFVVTGLSAAEIAGPSITVSYLLAAIVCMFVGLAYTEVATMIPTSGSVYSYTYVTLGEFFAWMVACFLVLEYTVGASTVASGWSGYLVGILKSGGIMMPEHLTKGPSNGGIINLPAVIITLLMTFVLMRGTKESKVLNTVLVGVKLLAIFLFVAIAAPKINFENWNPFMPFGTSGVIVGSATIFFAFIGFDMIASTAEECKNPKRDLTIGIIGSLIVCAVLYMVVAATLTLIAPYQELGTPDALAHALRRNGLNIGGALVAVGGIAAMTSVLLSQMYGQSRIFMVMARDGLLPTMFAKIHPRFHTPYLSSLLIGIAVSCVSGLLPITMIAQLTSLGTLIAFMTVGIVVMMLRVQHPKIERTFKCPAVFVVAPLSILMCLYLAYTLFLENWLPFLIWCGFGILFYVGYSFKASNLTKYGHERQ